MSANDAAFRAFEKVRRDQSYVNAAKRLLNGWKGYMIGLREIDFVLDVVMLSYII